MHQRKTMTAKPDPTYRPTRVVSSADRIQIACVTNGPLVHGVECDPNRNDDHIGGRSERPTRPVRQPSRLEELMSLRTATERHASLDRAGEPGRNDRRRNVTPRVSPCTEHVVNVHTWGRESRCTVQDRTGTARVGYVDGVSRSDKMPYLTGCIPEIRRDSRIDPTGTDARYQCTEHSVIDTRTQYN